MTIDTFTTPRLAAHRIADSDYEDYSAMRDDPMVGFWLGGPLSEAKKQQHHRDCIEHWKQHGFGIWMLRTKDADEFAGRVGLRKSTATGVEEVELLYAMLPKFWKQGLCTEASREALRIGFESLGLNQIVAFTMTTNLGSRRVMEKCGMTFERVFEYYELPHALYRIKKV